MLYVFSDQLIEKRFDHLGPGAVGFLAFSVKIRTDDVGGSNGGYFIWFFFFFLSSGTWTFFFYPASQLSGYLPASLEVF
jgi:hypothetical protein